MAILLKDAFVSSNASTNSWIRTPYGVRLSENPVNSFKNLLQMEKFIMAQDGGDSATIAEWMKVLEDESLGSGNSNKDGLADGNVFYSKTNFTDTRVGGNDAINPYWQFNIDDDIVPPSLIIKESGGPRGMGRVYNEVYDTNQQILWMSMGVPEYVNLVSFYRDAGNINAARAMNRGTLRGIAGKLIKLVFSATIWAITFPVLAPFWVNRWISRIQTERVSKYYYFKPAMVLYYEMVNTMLSYLAVGMGLYPQWIIRRRDSTKVLHAQYAQMQGEPDPEQSILKVSNVTQPNDISRAMSSVGVQPLEPENTQQQEPEKPSTINTDLVLQRTRAASTNGVSSTYTGNVKGQRVDYGVNGIVEQQEIKDEYMDRLKNLPIKDSGIPEILHNGPDIFAIINRRAMIFNQARYKYTTRMLMDEMLSNTDQTGGNNHWTSPDVKYVSDSKGNISVARDPKDAEKTGAWTNTWNSLKANIFGAGDYVGFRVERGVNCSESISNQTGPTGVAQKLNQYAQKQREAYENYGNSWIAKTVGKLVENPGDFFSDVGKDIAGQLASSLGIGDIGAVLTQGNGFLDIPDVWKGSSFSKSYSFNIQLRARYGDPVSIFQSVYIPLIMLLAAAMPRSVGDSMYTSPFLIKAYCKGMFAVPCGIIESMSISRGKDEFGWSHDHLPTAVDVNIQIKDMTPTFFLSMQDIGLFDTFSRNDNMMEYLDTLSALGITERLYLWPKAMRKLTAAFLTKRNTIFNSNYWGYRLGRNNVARLIAAVTPFSNAEKSDIYGNATGNVFNTNDSQSSTTRYVVSN